MKTIIAVVLGGLAALFVLPKLLRSNGNGGGGGSGQNSLLFSLGTYLMGARISVLSTVLPVPRSGNRSTGGTSGLSLRLDNLNGYLSLKATVSISGVVSGEYAVDIGQITELPKTIVLKESPKVDLLIQVYA